MYTDSLTASHIRYLLVFKKLAEDGSGVRSIDLARELGYSKPSVHSMINTLSKMNLVCKKEHGRIFFTEQGYKTAQIYENYYMKVKDKLFGSVVTDTHIEKAIYALLSELPEQYLASSTFSEEI